MLTALKVSPLAPKGGFPSLPNINGVTFSTISAGIKYKDRTDLMLASIVPGSTIAGVFTQSATRSASVLDCQKKISVSKNEGKGFAFLVNSGNSNAFTGKNGQNAVDEIIRVTTETLKIPNTHIYTSSTGVIGEPLPTSKITKSIGKLHETLSPNKISDAAQAIMTTDTFPKGATAEVMIEGEKIKISGIAKGSGMIAPDMATMLVYIFSDVKISQKILQKHVSVLLPIYIICI